MPGKLLVVATPLGNLDDASPRVLAALREADCIACEDTRRTSKLLARFSIERPTVSYHLFNELGRVAPLVERLRAGETVALVSDAGTPGISDPGEILVAAAWAEGIDVVPIPGPSAVATILSASGLPASRYVFDGFLPARGGERRQRLRELADEPRTIVLFEAPHRIRACLSDIAEVLGNRPLVLGRELTKRHETILRGSAAELLAALGEAVRGEIVLVLAGARAEVDALPVPGDESCARVVTVWREALDRTGGDRRRALREAARALGMKRAELYRRLAEAKLDVPPGTDEPGGSA